MASIERVVENLNRGLHVLFAKDSHVFLIGEDLLDPYGGAFKVSRGLSSKYPDRVLTTPLSEAAIMGLAGGLALCGERPIVEMMFGDFLALGFDQVLNFSTKSVSMYGRKLDLNMVIRCPVGANRAYGPTHSQNPQKHFIGIPNLDLFELSPFHDSAELLERLVHLGHPCILFEDKVLYTQTVYRHGLVDDLFRFELLGPDHNFARVFSDAFDKIQCLLIAPGGLVSRSLTAARELFIDFEIETQILTPLQIYPLRIDPILDWLQSAEHIFIAEESVAGGTWGGGVAQAIYDRLWARLKSPIRLVHSKDSIIPSSPHLEKRVIIQKEDIYQAIRAEVVNA